MRMKILLNLGEPYAPGESGIDSDLREGLDLGADKIGYHGRQRGPVPGAKPGRARGMGLSIGFKDQGGVNKPASAQVKTTTTGGIIVNCGSVEIGQGIQTALTCIVAEILGTDENRVSYAPINTDITPFDQGTNASSGICVMGQAIERAARDVRRQVIEFAAARLACAPNDLELDDWVIRRGNESHPLAPMIMGYYGGTGFEFIGHGFFKPETSDDAPLETPCVAWEIGWGGAEIEIDEETGQVTVLRLVVSGDAGRAIHPLVCRGQEEGAAVMGLGQSLLEAMRYDGARLTNIAPIDYRVPLASDLPADFQSVTQEQGHGAGPFGSKGMGEGAMLPVASAIANAIEDALGVRITELPITPERVLAALDAKR
jgi:CO/xanthine dehydrogenase Mo-binding subunit